VPQRPNHPDFRLLAQSLREHDASSEVGASIEQVLAPFVDADSAIYVAEHRALRIGRGTGRMTMGAPAKAMITATWLDGLLAGVRLAALRAGSHLPETTNGPERL
jgi:hypothetical protein